MESKSEKCKTEERQPDEVLKERSREWLNQHYPGRGYEQLRKNSPDLLAAFAQSIQAESRAQGMREAARIVECFFTRSDMWTVKQLTDEIERAAEPQKQRDKSRCSLCGASRIPINREGTRFGACTFINCKDPVHDYNREQALGAQVRLLATIVMLLGYVTEEWR